MNCREPSASAGVLVGTLHLPQWRDSGSARAGAGPQRRRCRASQSPRGSRCTALGDRTLVEIVPTVQERDHELE
jgi:hypothetical protein